MKRNTAWPLWVGSLCLGMGAMLAPLAQAQDLISTVRQKPLILFAQPDDTSEQRTVAVPDGKLPAGWTVLGNTPAFYQIQAGTEGQGWVRRSAITILRDAGMADTRCVASNAPRIVGGTAGAGRICAN